MSTQPPNGYPIPPRHSKTPNVSPADLADLNVRSHSATYSEPHPATQSTTPPEPQSAPTDAAPPDAQNNNAAPSAVAADQYYWQHWPEIQAQFLQQQLADAVDRSEKFAKQLDQQMKFFKAGFGVLAVVFTGFFTYLQIRQIFLDGRESRRASRQDSWELINAVISNDTGTSAGLTFAIETLTQQCESLSGLDLKNRYLPEIEFVPPSGNSVNSGIERIGYVFGVLPDRYCAQHEHVDLRGINLEGSTLFDAKFRDADLQGANFQAAKLHSTTFTAVDLRESNFQDAQLNQVKFKAADLAGSNLSRAMLPGAAFLQDEQNAAPVTSNLSNLKGANLLNAQFCEFPEGSDPQAMTMTDYVNYCADLRQTQNLAFEQIQQAQDWQYALYNSATCKDFKEQGMTEATAPVSCQTARSQSAHLTHSKTGAS